MEWFGAVPGSAGRADLAGRAYLISYSNTATYAVAGTVSSSCMSIWFLMKYRHQACTAATGRRNALWSGSYFAGSVGGVPISVLRQYIEQQKHPARPAHAQPPSPPALRPAH